ARSSRRVAPRSGRASPGTPPPPAGRSARPSGGRGRRAPRLAAATLPTPTWPRRSRAPRRSSSRRSGAGFASARRGRGSAPSSISTISPSCSSSPAPAAEALRGKPLDPPAAALAPVKEAVVEPGHLALPELDLLVARDGARGEALAGLAHPAVELVAVGQGRALLRGPGAELAQARAGREVGIRGGTRQAVDPSPDAHLAIQLPPVDHERRVRVDGELAPLRGAVVGVEAEAVAIEALEEDHAGVGPALLVGGRQADGVRERHLRLGPRPPLGELVDRVRAQHPAAQRGQIGPARHGAGA